MDRMAENMSATVHIPTSPKRLLSILPRDALIKFQGKDFVYTVKEDKAAILPVNIVTYLGNSVGADNPYFAEGMPVVIEGSTNCEVASISPIIKTTAPQRSARCAPLKKAHQTMIIRPPSSPPKTPTAAAAGMIDGKAKRTRMVSRAIMIPAFSRRILLLFAFCDIVLVFRIKDLF